MKIIIQLLLLCLVTSCATNSSVVRIPAKQTLTVATPNYEMCEVALKNKSFKNVNVNVVNEATGEFVRGFGLGGFGREEVMVEQDAKLKLTNTTNQTLKVGLAFSEKKVRSSYTTTPVVSSDKTIDFTLANTSIKSIPLIIPNVMNPNLSPSSKSGVELKIGQEILFRANGKKHVLLVVDENIKEGELIDVAKLLKERKKELGL